MEDGLKRLAEALDAVAARHEVRSDLAREARTVLTQIRTEAFAPAPAVSRSWWPWSATPSVIDPEVELMTAMRHRQRCEDLRHRLGLAEEGVAHDAQSLAAVVVEVRRARSTVLEGAALVGTVEDATAVALQAGGVDAVASALTTLELRLPESARVLEELHQMAVALSGVLDDAEAVLRALPRRDADARRLAAVVEGVRTKVERVVRSEADRGLLDAAKVDRLAMAFEPVPPACSAALAAEQELVETLRGRSVEAILAAARARLSES